MAKKKKGWKILILVIVLLAIGITAAVFIVQQTGLGEQWEELEESSCNTQQDCIDYLTAQGMPEGFLTENNIELKCEGKKCLGRTI